MGVAGTAVGGLLRFGGMFGVSRHLIRSAPLGKTGSAISAFPRIAGLGGIALLSANQAAYNSVMRPFPTAYTVTGFGSGFGMHGGKMRSDGGIGATGDIVLNARNHGRF
jgi:hypothetical protein